MAAGDYVGTAVGTLAATGPGTIASVAVTILGVSASDIITITPTNSVSDTNGAFIPYVYSIATDTVTLKVDRAQLPSALTVRVLAHASS